MSRVVIVGAGGHGGELADVARACAGAGQPIELLGYVDDDPSRAGKTVRGLPVLGGMDWLVGRADIEVVCGIGSPKVRKRVVDSLSQKGVRFRGLVHPRAELTPYVRLGLGVVITAGCVLTNDIVLGEHVHLNRLSTVGHDCRLGPFVHIAPGAVLSGNVTVSEGCDVGTNASVIQNLSIGAWSIIGAGAAVIDDIPAHCTAVGVPARVIKRAA